MHCDNKEKRNIAAALANRRKQNSTAGFLILGNITCCMEFFHQTVSFKSLKSRRKDLCDTSPEFKKSSEKTNIFCWKPKTLPSLLIVSSDLMVVAGLFDLSKFTDLFLFFWQLESCNHTRLCLAKIVFGKPDCPRECFYPPLQQWLRLWKNLTDIGFFSACAICYSP